MAGTDGWTLKENKIQQAFLWALEPEATHQKTKSEYRTDPDNTRNYKLKKLYNVYSSPERNKHNSRKDFFGAKQNDTETAEDHWE